MLISITEQCRMGCSHCMDNATPEGNHMSMDTFKKAVDFFNQYGSLEFIITGGEPTENPEWLNMISYAIRNVHGSNVLPMAHITLTTNGMNIVNNKDTQHALEDLISIGGGKFSVQVTHVGAYYPIDLKFHERFFRNKNVFIATEIESMYPLGRAKENNLPWNSKCSKCFNIRSAVRSSNDLSTGIIMLASHWKFCTPRINWNGDIKLGESRICPTVATIYDSNEDITNNIRNFHCGICSEVNKQLTKEQLAAIGE